MKKISGILLCALISFSVSAQQFKDLDNVPLKSDADFKKAEPTAKDCAKYVLSHPSDGKDDNAMLAEKFLIKWMSGTPDYSFDVDADAVKYTGNDKFLLGAYMAAMLKAVLDKPELAKDPKTFKIAAFKVFAEYCADEKNHVTKTAELKKLIEANKKGKIEEALDMSKVK